MPRPRSSLARAGVALCALVLVAVGVAGCGEEEGVAGGGAVNAYVEAPLCDGEQGRVVEIDPGDGDPYEVRFVCLPDPRGPGLSQGVGGKPRRIDLALVGRNARRATRDSASIAFLEARDPAVNRFTEPILEAAGIGWMRADSRAAATAELTAILREADPSSLRADVRAELGR